MLIEDAPILKLPCNKQGFQEHIDVIIYHGVIAISGKYEADNLIKCCNGNTKKKRQIAGFDPTEPNPANDSCNPY